MDKLELIQHAFTWAIKHRKVSDKNAMKYAEWYAVNYPNGNKDHYTAFSYWETLQTA